MVKCLLSLCLTLPLTAQLHISACTPTDSGFTGGTCYTAGMPLPAGAPSYLGQERGGDFSYSFPVADGLYTVTLHFIENSTAVTAPGQRVFNASINGAKVVDSLDIFASVGLNSPLDRTFQVTSTGGAGITISFTTVIRRAVVSAIDVTPVVAPVNPFPGCLSDGAGGIKCTGSLAAGGSVSAGAGQSFDSAITWGGITYRLPTGDGTGKRLTDSGVAPCGNVDPAALALGPTCHQFIWAP